MKIHLYTLCWNEIDVLPFVIDYWKRIPVDKAIVYDNGSTDGSVEYLKQFDWIEVKHFETEGMNDFIQRDIKNNCWKESRGIADFVIVCDMDECLFLPNGLKTLKMMKENHYTICVPKWYDFISEEYPKYVEGKLLHEISNRAYIGDGKCILFDPNEINEINYSVGAHQHNPNGNVKYYVSPNVYVLHINHHLSLEYLLNRYKTMEERLSKDNKNNHLCIHYSFSEEKLQKDYEEGLKKSINFNDLMKSEQKCIKKYAIITFLFNNYDLLREPLIIDENFDYYCLTDDKNLTSKNWKCIYIKQFDTDKLSGVQKTYMAKYSFYKYVPTFYKYYMNIDASIEIKDKLTDIMLFFEKNNYDIGLSMHPENDNYFDEYKQWVKVRNLEKKYVKIFKNFCKTENVKENEKTGLIECTVKIYKNKIDVISFIEEVFLTLKKWCNFEDKNEQCYFTQTFKRYIDNLNTCYFYRQFYSNSEYFNSYFHKTNTKWVNNVTKEENTKILFGRNVYLNEFDKNKKDELNIFIGTYKSFKPSVSNESYKIIVGNHEIENDSKLELINCKCDSKLDDTFYSEIYMLKWISENYELKDYVGYCHYRKYFSFMDEIPNMDEIFEKYDAIVAKPLMYKTNVKEQYSSCHNIEDLYIIGGILADKYPEYCNTWHKFLNNKIFFPYNMFIMKRDDFKEYITFIYDVLDEYLKIVGTDIIKRIGNNVEKYLKKQYPNNTIDYQYRIGGYLAERLTNLFIITHFKKLQAYPVKITEDKYKSDE